MLTLNSLWLLVVAVLLHVGHVQSQTSCFRFADSAIYLSYSPSCLNGTVSDACINGLLDYDCQCVCLCQNNYGGRNCDIAPTRSYISNFGMARSFKRRANSTALYVPTPLSNAFTRDQSAPTFTVEFWLQVDFAPEWNGRGFSIFETRSSLSSTVTQNIFLYSAGHFWLVQQIGNGVGLYPIFKLPYDIKVGEPLHVALTSDNLARVGTIPPFNRIYTLYINGVYIGEAMARNTFPFFSTPIFVGTWEGVFTVVSPNSFWQGESIVINTQGLHSVALDEFRVWDRPLTQEELSATMFKPVIGVESGLILYFNFNDGNETVAENKAFGLGTSNPALFNGLFFNSRTNSFDVARKYSNSFSPLTYPLFIPSFVPSSSPRALASLFSQRTIGNVGSYTPRGKLYGHACVGIEPTSSIWCFSGSDTTESAIPSGIDLIIVYNITTGLWRQVRPLVVKKFLFHHAFTLDNKHVMIIGGDILQSAALHMFDTETEQWVEPPSNNIAQSTAGPLFAPGRVIDKGVVWNFGGADLLVGGTLLPHDRLYKLDTTTWRMEQVNPTTPWPPPRMLACLSTFTSDSLILYGGISSISDSAGYSDIWIFNIPTQTWRLVTNVPAPADKLWPSCVSIGQSVAIYGGATGLSLRDALTSTSAAADFAAQSIRFFDIYPSETVPVVFRTIAPGAAVLRPTRFAQATVVLKSRLYVFGGFLVNNRISPDDPASDIVWDDRMVEVNMGCELGQGIQASGLCAPCEPGYYQNEPYGSFSLQECQPCRPGEYQPSAGQIRCLACPVGNYSMTNGSSSCQSCPTGYTTLRPGSTSSDACQLASSQQSDNSIGVGVGVGLPLALLVVGAIVGVAIYFRLRQERKRIEQEAYGALPTFELSDDEIGDTKLIKRSDVEVGEEIGSGSFGTVYKGRFHGRDVAIKVSKPGSKEGMIAFLREADVMQNLPPHKHVVQLEGVCMASGSAWVVLQYMDGGSLEDLLTRGYEPSERELRSMILQLVSGLRHLHSNRVIHRDLAARNVLLCKKKSADDDEPDSIGKYQLKLSDFGMSRQVDQSDKGQTASNIGPVAWMAPEAFRQEYSAESDIWSLGIVIWEIITGLSPTNQMPLVDLAVKIRDEAYHPRIAQVWPNWVQQILQACWAPDPKNRMGLDEIEQLARSASVASNKSDSRYLDVGTVNARAAPSKRTIADDIAELRLRLERLQRETAQLESERERLLRGESDSTPHKGQPKSKGKERDNDHQNSVELQSFAPPAPDKSNWRRTAAPSQLTNTYGPVPARENE